MASYALAGKKAVITGASGGIGFAIASRFAQEGASVVLAGRTRSKLERSLAKLQETGEPQGLQVPQSHRIHCLDVGEGKEWEGLVKENVRVYLPRQCTHFSLRLFRLSFNAMSGDEIES
jgi:3-oxoacyl-[acyl-carrier protein] reductase